MRDRIFYAICFGFIFGVFLRSLVFLNLYLVTLLCVISFALVLFFSLISKNKCGIIISVFVLIFSFGVFRFHITDNPAPSVFESQVGQAVNFSGIVVYEPDIKENNQKLTVEVNQSGEKTKILTSVNLGEDFKYGDEIIFTGKLQKPENFITDQGKVFDYVNYLR